MRSAVVESAVQAALDAGQPGIAQDILDTYSVKDQADGSAILFGATLNSLNGKLESAELTADIQIGDLFLEDDNAILYLKGHTLTIDTSYHTTWGTTNRVIYDSGQIIWIPQGSVLFLR